MFQRVKNNYECKRMISSTSDFVRPFFSKYNVDKLLRNSLYKSYVWS